MPKLASDKVGGPTRPNEVAPRFFVASGPVGISPVRYLSSERAREGSRPLGFSPVRGPVRIRDKSGISPVRDLAREGRPP